MTFQTPLLIPHVLLTSNQKLPGEGIEPIPPHTSHYTTFNYTVLLPRAIEPLNPKGNKQASVP